MPHEIEKHIKPALIVAGIATLTLLAWNYLAGSNIPVLTPVAQKITGKTSTPTAA